MSRIFSGIKTMEDLRTRKRRVKKAIIASEQRLDENFDGIGEALNPMTYVNKAVSALLGREVDINTKSNGSSGIFGRIGSTIANILLSIIDGKK